MKRTLYFADLTHTAQGISAPTFPLGIGFVVSHARKELGTEFEYRLFKFPDALEQALRESPATVLAMSNYSWNLELAYAVASLAKKRQPGLVVVFGGPNYPILDGERAEFLRRRPAVDFYIQLEGESGFAELIRRLDGVGFDAARLREALPEIPNCSYLSPAGFRSGPVDRIREIDSIPSPYLSGVLDPFFDLPLIPMLETTRGCPFSCTFCSDGLSIKNKVVRFKDGRTREELRYIAERVKMSDELIVTDLNFGMYEEDQRVCEEIAHLQGERHWPVLVKGSAGKNKPDKVIAAASLLKGTWVVGGAVQSTDPVVLKAIKRSNISSEAYGKLIDYGNRAGENAQTYSEIILCLPGDTKRKHFESLRFGMDRSVNSLRMYQAMLLAGTEMDTAEARKTYGLITRFRTIPGCVGMYPLFGEERPIAEIEEIIVGSDTMSFDDYVDCRVMNLLIETFYNNALFEEVFNMVRALGASVFDCILHVHEHPELRTPKVARIIGEFIFQTSQDLYQSREEAASRVLTPGTIARYVGGELGINELLVHKALLFSCLEEITPLAFAGAEAVLRKRGLWSPAVARYVEELDRFIRARKKDALTDTRSVYRESFHYDFRAIAAAEYQIDPNGLSASPVPVEYSFFHDEEQKRHIASQRAIYAETPIGLGRLIQRSNLKLVYRRFEPAPAALPA